MTYGEKLKSPEWQKKRLEILKRDEFTCTMCNSKDKQLHVHHKVYIFDKDPWEYKNSNFITLCYQCHQIEEDFKIKYNELVHDLLIMGHSYIELYTILFDNIFKADEQKDINNG